MNENEKEVFSLLAISDKILLLFFASLSCIEEVLDEIPGPRSVIRQLYTTYPEYFKKNKETVTERVFYRLFEKRFLERIAKAESQRYQLTSEGLSYLLSKFPQLRLKQKKFDGFWRFFVYDIEEAKRKTRYQVRKGLKSLGFRMIQKSVWASPYDWEREIDQFLKGVSLDDSAMVLRAKLPSSKTQKLLKEFWPDLLKTEERVPKEADPISNLLSITSPIKV